MDAGTAPGGDGASWVTAFDDLQDALAAAEDGDEIWVAEGTYRPTPGDDRTVSFDLPSRVAVYGGFEGDETSLDERDPEAHETTLSGDIGEQGYLGDNSHHIVTALGTEETLLDGFTIRSGLNGEGYGSCWRGGAGLCALGPAPSSGGYTVVLRNSVLTDNHVSRSKFDSDAHGGGALADGGAAVRLEHVSLIDNSACHAKEGGEGGGMFIGSGRGELVDITFRDNSVCSDNPSNAGQLDVSAYISEGIAVLRGVRFECSQSQVCFGGSLVAAGGLGRIVGSDVLVRGATTTLGLGFVASASAGGVEPTVDLTNIQFLPDTLIGRPSVLIYISSSNTRAVLTNALLVANADKNTASCIVLSGMLELRDATFAYSRGPGPAISVGSGAETLLANSILWENGNEEIEVAPGASVRVENSLVAGGCPSGATCEDVLDADPRFVRAPSPGPDSIWGSPDDDLGDLRLLADSPALDAGDTSLLPPDTADLDDDGDTAEPLPLDLDGEPRVVEAGVDLGAYEAPPDANGSPTPVDDDASAFTVTSVLVDVLANDADPDGDALSLVSVSGGGEVGTATVTTEGLVSFTAGRTEGISVHPYVVADEHGVTATATLTVTVTLNRPPVALADTARTTPGASVAVDVLANDADPEGHQLRLVSVHGGGRLGTPMVTSDGRVSFTAAPDAEGTAVVTYVVADEQGASAAGTLTVTIAPDPPPLPSDLALRGAFPNPTAGPVTFSLDMPDAAIGALVLHDPLGRVVLEQSFRFETGGSNQRFIADLGGLPAGVYVYRLAVHLPGASHALVGSLARIK